MQIPSNRDISYNFITKPEKKQSILKSKIVEQILQNSIDQWDNLEQNSNSHVQEITFNMDQVLD